MANKRRKLQIAEFSPIAREAAQTDRAAALAIFLQENTGSVCGSWNGNIAAADQRAMFGAYIGKGHFSINGAPEFVMMTVKVCFGTDFDVRFKASWAQLCQGVDQDGYSIGKPAKFGRAA